MKNILRSPKTTFAGIAVIIGALLPVIGVPVATAIAISTACTGLGLILSKDADVTGTEGK
jgi:hypothetical protein